MNGRPWDDARLGAAFAARASHARTPGDLAAATSAALQTRPSSATTWRRLLAPAAVVIVAVGAVTGGMALLGSQRGSTALVEFRNGPTPDVRTLDARTLAFDFPADWHAYDSSTAGSALSSVAVLGTHPVEAQCGDERHVQVNCVNERRLQPGEMRMNVGTGTFFGGTFKDRPSISNGRTVRLQIDGQVAILDDVETSGDDYYGATESLHLYVEQPGEPNQIVLIDLIARDHGSDEVLRVMRGVIDTFHFDATAFPSPPDWWAGRAAMGLPVISVSDAIAIRDAGVDGQEIAVHGWFSPIGPMSCPYTLATSPVQPVCPDQYVVLMAEPESLVTREANGFSGREPTGTAIQIDLDDLDGGWQPGLPDLGPAQPAEIAVVGHFDDRRSSACPADQLAACRDRFVVDRLDWVNGETKPTSLVDLAPGAGRPFDEAQAVLEVVRPQVTVLSAVHVAGTDLSRIEPTIAGRRGGLVQEKAMWIVRVLADRAPATYLYVDNTADLYELGADGPTLMAPTSGDPSGPPATTAVLGVPVISVPELIARRTGGPAPSPEEVAVRGWMIRSNVVYDCAVPDVEQHPLVPRCLAPTFLMERPERPTELTTDGPSVTPLLGLDSHIEVDIPWQEPVEVIAIGHLGDHRWPTCQPVEQDACRRVFVADRLIAASTSLEGLPEPWRIPRSAATEPRADPLDVVSRLELLLGDITVASLGHVAAGLLGEIEPAVMDRGDIDSATQQYPVWVVRALVAGDPEPGMARTFIMADVPAGQPALPIWDANVDGVAPVPEPEQSLRWIPRGAHVVELPFEVGPGRPKVLVAVVDQTRHLVDARAATSAEIAVRDITTNTVWIADLPDGGVLVDWGGSMCDDFLTLTISASDAGIPDRVTVDGRRGSPCRLMLAYYAVVLTFDPHVAAGNLAGRYLIGP